MMKVDVKSAVDGMRKEFRDLTNAEFHLGIARALNHTISKTKTATSREIRMIYNLTGKDVGKALTLHRANSRQLYAMVIASGKPIPLMSFKPTQTARGVSVMVKKGNRQEIRGGVLMTMRSGRQGIFARGKHNGGDFEFRHKRIKAAEGYVLVNGRYRPKNNDLAIGELSSLSVPKAMTNAVVLRQLDHQLTTDFPNRMMHELSRMRG